MYILIYRSKLFFLDFYYDAYTRSRPSMCRVRTKLFTRERNVRGTLTTDVFENETDRIYLRLIIYRRRNVCGHNNSVKCR